MLFWSYAHFCSFVHWKWYKKIVNLLICNLLANRCRSDISNAPKHHKVKKGAFWIQWNTTTWKVVDFKSIETPQSEKLKSVCSFALMSRSLSWNSPLWNRLVSRALPSSSSSSLLPESVSWSWRIAIFKSDLFALSPPISLYCGNWQKTFVCVCHASTYRLLSLSIPRTNASSWNLWCNILSNSHLKFTWNSPETSPPRWSRSESWNQNRAGSEIHWKWMVLGNPGKQASRQGRLTAIINSQESWHASERWWLLPQSSLPQ